MLFHLVLRQTQVEDSNFIYILPTLRIRQQSRFISHASLCFQTTGKKVSEVLIQVEIPSQEPHLSVFYHLFTWNGSSKHTKLLTSYHEQTDLVN